MKNKLGLFTIIILLLLICSAYCNTFYSPPVLDDYHSFIEEEKVYIHGLSTVDLLSLSDTCFGWYRWIPMVSFALDHYFGKGDLFFFHMTNLVVHLLCTLALVFLVFNLTKASKSARISLHGISPFLFAIWVAGLWGLNPVQTNAVTYLVQRMAAIQSLFYISCISFYFLGRRQSTTRPSLACYLLAVFSAGCAFLSKENAAMLPVMILATEIWFFRPNLLSDLWKALKNAHWSLRATTLLLTLLTVLLCIYQLDNIAASYGTRHFTMEQRLLTELRIVLWYASLFFAPLPSRLSLEHDIQLSTSLFTPPTTILSAIFLISLGWAILKYRKRYPLITYGVAWFLLNLVIESTVVPLELIFEHRLYLSSVGLSLSFSAGLLTFAGYCCNRAQSKELTKIGWSVFAILMSCLTLLTFQRNEAWRDFVSIQEDAVTKAPYNSRARANLAVALGRSGKYEEAIQEAEKAIEVGRQYDEDYFVAANAIIGSLISLRLMDDAVRRGEELFASHPERCDAGGLPAFCVNMAEVYLNLGQPVKAYSISLKGLRVVLKSGANPYYKKLLTGVLRKILEEAKTHQIDLDGDGTDDPGALPIDTWLAKIFIGCGAYPEAMNLLQVTLDKLPQDQVAATIMSDLEERIEANRKQAENWSYEKKYVRKPFSAFNLSMAIAYLVRKNRLPEPLVTIGDLCLNWSGRLVHDNPDVHLLKGWYDYEKGLYQEATINARTAIVLDPNYAKAWLGLGFFLTEQGDRTGAAQAFLRTLELYPDYPQKTVIIELISSLQRSVGDAPSNGGKVAPNQTHESIALTADGVSS